MIAILHDSPKHLIRSNQVGDWRYTDQTLIASASNELNDGSKMAVLIHELIECYLCQKHSITDESVVAFDDMYEKERADGKHGDVEEPGDDPRSPYRDEHQAATHVEWAVCSALGIPWRDHENSLG